MPSVSCATSLSEEACSAPAASKLTNRTPGLPVCGSTTSSGAAGSGICRTPTPSTTRIRVTPSASVSPWAMEISCGGRTEAEPPPCSAVCTAGSPTSTTGDWSVIAGWSSGSTC